MADVGDPSKCFRCGLAAQPPYSYNCNACADAMYAAARCEAEAARCHATIVASLLFSIDCGHITQSEADRAEKWARRMASLARQEALRGD